MVLQDFPVTTRGVYRAEMVYRLLHRRFLLFPAVRGFLKHHVALQRAHMGKGGGGYERYPLLFEQRVRFQLSLTRFQNPVPPSDAAPLSWQPASARKG